MQCTYNGCKNIFITRWAHAASELERAAKLCLMCGSEFPTPDPKRAPVSLCVTSTTKRKDISTGIWVWQRNVSACGGETGSLLWSLIRSLIRGLLTTLRGHWETRSSKVKGWSGVCASSAKGHAGVPAPPWLPVVQGWSGEKVKLTAVTTYSKTGIFNHASFLLQHFHSFHVRWKLVWWKKRC